MASSSSSCLRRRRRQTYGRRAIEFSWAAAALARAKAKMRTVYVQAASEVRTYRTRKRAVGGNREEKELLLLGAGSSLLAWRRLPRELETNWEGRAPARTVCAR